MWKRKVLELGWTQCSGASINTNIPPRIGHPRKVRQKDRGLDTINAKIYGLGGKKKMKETNCFTGKN